jgi:hypothetical protein
MRRERAIGFKLNAKTVGDMIDTTNKPIATLREAPQPPPSYAGAIPDSDRAKKPRLDEPSPTRN